LPERLRFILRLKRKTDRLRADHRQARWAGPEEDADRVDQADRVAGNKRRRSRFRLH
jgi:hypothetical protein